jgi:acetyltransferase
MGECLNVRLRDRTPVLVRPLGPDDRAALAEAYRRLSPEARYHRFWTHTGEMIGERMLDRLLAVDPATHAAWAVLDPLREFPGIGAASWWRGSPQLHEAEFSITVLDGDQGRGIGTLLLAVMWLTAFRAGMSGLVAYALPENRRAALWMRACGAEGSWDGYKLVYRWDLADLKSLPPTRAGAELADWLARLSPEILAETEPGRG